MKTAILNLNLTVKPIGDTPESVKASLDAQALVVAYFLNALEAQGVNVQSVMAPPQRVIRASHDDDSDNETEDNNKVIGPWEQKYMDISGRAHMRCKGFAKTNVVLEQREEKAKALLADMGQPTDSTDSDVDPLDGPSVAEAQGAQKVDEDLSDAEMLA